MHNNALSTDLQTQQRQITPDHCNEDMSELKLPEYLCLTVKQPPQLRSALQGLVETNRRHARCYSYILQHTRQKGPILE